MRFIVDRMLGKLAKTLRMLGYDTLYFKGEDAHELIQRAREEDRVILTRSTKLTPKRAEDRILWIKEDDPFQQLKELFQKGHLSPDEDSFFSRCLLCNVLLDQIPQEKAAGKVPDFTFHQHPIFFRCPKCGRIYWPGSHQKNMRRRFQELGISTKSQVPNQT